MSEEKSLPEEIFGVCLKRLKKTFVDQSEVDERNFPKLARICENVEPEKWEEWERPQALISTMRRAIELMPDAKPPHCPVSWKHIARTLCGFRGDLELRPGEVEFSYKMDYIPALRSECNLPERTLGRHVESSRKLLANALMGLEKQSLEGSGKASVDEPAMNEKGASEKPSKEPDSPPVNQSNYGLFNLVSHGPTSINLKKSVYAGGVSIALVIAVLLATNLGSGSPDGSSEADSSSGPVEAEASNSVSDSSAAPVIRGEEILVTGDCFGGSMIPNKTIQDVDALDEEIEERGLRDGTLESGEELDELMGTVDSVIAVSFVVHASRDAPVTIDKITPEIVESPAPEGVILRSDCGDPMPSHFTRLDLDSETFDTELPTNVNHPLGTKALDDISAELNYYELVDLGLPFEITEGNPGSFLVVPTTEECWCEWTLTVEWSSHEDEGEITFDNEGEPFVTVSPSQMDAYRFTDAQSGTSWVQEDL